MYQGRAVSLGRLGFSPAPDSLGWRDLVPGVRYEIPGVIQVADPAFGALDDVRLSTAGWNVGLLGERSVLDGLRAAVGHCVMVSAELDRSGLLRVLSWRRLAPADSWAFGGLRYTCDEYQRAVFGRGDPVPDPSAPTSGGVVPDTGPSAPAGGPSAPAGGGALGSGTVALAGAALLLLALPRRSRR